MKYDYTDDIKAAINPLSSELVVTKPERDAEAALGSNGDGAETALVSIPRDDTATVQPEPVTVTPPSIATSLDILDDFASVLHARGVVGEHRFAKVTYLCLTSRVLGRPISLAAKGPSSAGKSFVVQEVVKFFPPSAYYALSSMSEHALAYSQEPLSHRFLILYEAAGLESDFASYLLRSLLSEGHIRYETVDKKKGEGLVSRLIEREGPTGLIVTTTQVSLHPENETRLLSVPANDTPQQTAAIIRMLACEDGHAGDDDLEEWRTLQTWVAAQDNRVTVPFALRLADLVPPVAVRLRRDFATVLNLTKAHAILHQETRQRDASGRIVATVADYGIVRGLVADLVADEVGATVPATVVDTVAAVVALVEKNEAGVTYTQLGERLKLDKSSASRRAQVAVDRGYLHNLEDRKGRPARLVIGEPLPGEVTILPTVETLTGCMVARVSGGIGTRVAHSVSDDHVDDDPAIPVVAADLFGRAVAVVVSTGAASEHLIVTRCDCGQDEAVATLAELEKAGVVAPANGGKSRTVLIHEGDVESVVSAYTTHYSGDRRVDRPCPLPELTEPKWALADGVDVL